MLPFNMGAGGASGAYTGDIPASLRFRSGAGAYLSRTFGTPTAQNTWTLSFWVKQAGSISTAAAGGVFMRKVDTQNFESIAFDPNAGSDTNKLGSFTRTTSGTNNRRASSDAVYRDPTAWHNVVVVKSVSQASSAPTFYVNGVSISVPTRSSAGTPQDFINSAAAHIIGQDAQSTTTSDFYLARICFVDGTALTPSSFGYLNTEINEWVSKSQSAVKAVVDAGGTNSFMLDFDDATSLTTLGYDKSSKGNNWTLNNFSLTAGTSYDWMLDVPGNSFVTLNPLYAHPSGNINTLSKGNLQNDTPNSTGNAHKMWGYSSQIVTSGKWQVEVTNLTNFAVGICRNVNANTSGTGLDNAIRISSGSAPTVSDGASGTVSGTVPATSGTDVISLEFDVDAASLTVYRNGTSVATVTGITYSATARDSGGWLFISGPATSTATGVSNINFGQYPFTSTATYDSASGGYFHHTPTTGYKALCQRNMPDPAILNPSSAVVHRFEAGSGIATAIASDRSGWSDWMEWFKRTDTAESWKIRFSDDSSNMMAFDTNGAKAAWSAPSAGTYLGTAFKVGATYGVVTGTYSGDSTSNKNISHSLGKAPTCGIVKNESTGTWYVWHTKMTSAAYFTTLNSATPPAQSSTNTPWGTGNWSSTQFMVTNNATNNLNATGSTYRYILFADINGLLALLGHTGNASTDGAFEYAGHKGQLLIEKDLSATTGFYLWSDKIDTYNVTTSYLLLNTNAGTAAATGVDICSNAVKYRSATIANASNPHMGIAFADVPAKYSLAR